MSGTKAGAAKTAANRKRPPTGRPTTLTAEIEARIIASRVLGLSWERCAKLAGVARASVKNWQDRGRAALEKPASQRNAFDNKCIDFLIASEQADDEWVRRCETVLQMSMSPAQNEAKWASASSDDKDRAARVAMFKLTHQAPDEYSTKTSTELSGPDGGPLFIDGKQALALLREIGEDDE